MVAIVNFVVINVENRVVVGWLRWIRCFGIIGDYLTLTP